MTAARIVATFPLMTALVLMTTLSIVTPPAQVLAADTQDDRSGWFDFWIGDWDLTWTEADGAEAAGRNSVTRVLDGRVIQENFEALSGGFAGYKGRSWSVFNATSGEWKQTWVDNQGAYLDFVGSRDGDRYFFSRVAKSPLTGEPIHQRMMFYDISESGFTWDWQNSRDAGESWNLQWRIDYRRHGD